MISSNVAISGMGHVMSYYVMPCCVISFHGMSCHAIFISCHVMPCHVISYHVISCHVMSYHVTWDVTEIYCQMSNVILCHVMTYHIIFRVRPRIGIINISIWKNCYYYSNYWVKLFGGLVLLIITLFDGAVSQIMPYLTEQFHQIQARRLKTSA